MSKTEEIQEIQAPGGIIKIGEPESAYHANSALSRSDLMKIWDSPAKFRAAQDAKERAAEAEGLWEEEGE